MAVYLFPYLLILLFIANKTHLMTVENVKNFMVKEALVYTAMKIEFEYSFISAAHFIMESSNHKITEDKNNQIAFDHHHS